MKKCLRMGRTTKNNKHFALIIPYLSIQFCRAFPSGLYILFLDF